MQEHGDISQHCEINIVLLVRSDWSTESRTTIKNCKLTNCEKPKTRSKSAGNKKHSVSTFDQCFGVSTPNIWNLNISADGRLWKDKPINRVCRCFADDRLTSTKILNSEISLWRFPQESRFPSGTRRGIQRFERFEIQSVALRKSNSSVWTLSEHCWQIYKIQQTIGRKMTIYNWQLNWQSVYMSRPPATKHFL